MANFSESVQNWLNAWCSARGLEYDKLTKEQLEELKDDVKQQIDDDGLLDLSIKLLGNGAYGASSHPSFFFYNIALASDITAESRETTHYMERCFEDFFHNEWWERTDLHEKFGITLDQSKKDWYKERQFTVYGDTDSLYCCYGDLFATFTPETVPPTDEAKLDWILRFNKEFLDKWNNERLDERFNSRHGQNIHEFELETVAKSGIFLAKKKYIQGLSFSKGNRYLGKHKVKGKGVEIIKSSTPALARKILTAMVDMLLYEFTKDDKNAFIGKFAGRLKKYREEWMIAPIEEISCSANIGNYTQNVLDDVDDLVVKTSAGMATKGIARYNYLCNQNGLSNLTIRSGKVKYYYIGRELKDSSVFAFPAGEHPEWAPECARIHQFQKCIIDPLNRFCESLRISKLDFNCNYAFSLFDM